MQNREKLTGNLLGRTRYYQLDNASRANEYIFIYIYLHWAKGPLCDGPGTFIVFHRFLTLLMLTLHHLV